MEVLKHNLKVTPYDYQQEGILFGLRKKRFLIGDEPGLGKTLQSIGVVPPPLKSIGRGSLKSLPT